MCHSVIKYSLIKIGHTVAILMPMITQFLRILASTDTENERCIHKTEGGISMLNTLCKVHTM